MNITKTDLAKLVTEATRAAMAELLADPTFGMPARAKKKVVLLSSSVAADIGIKTEKSHLKTPTWDYLGQRTTCVWPLLDVMGGSQCLKVKAVAHIKKNGIGWSTVGHNAHSDSGPVYIAKYGAESLYAAVDDVVAAVLASSPRAGKKVVADFQAKYA